MVLQILEIYFKLYIIILLKIYIPWKVFYLYIPCFINNAFTPDNIWFYEGHGITSFQETFSSLSDTFVYESARRKTI